MEQNVDTFFVGDGSYQLVGLKEKDPFSEQLVGIHSAVDLKALSEDVRLKSSRFKKLLIKSENDLQRFSPEDTIPVDDYEEVFQICKRQVYDIFSFLLVKSRMMGSTPVREEDLVLTDDDRHLINHLENIGITEYSTVDKIARMSALSEMGIGAVVFKEVDGCQVCKSLDGSIFAVDKIFTELISNAGFPHPGGDFDIIPVIQRESYQGFLEDFLDRDFEFHGVKFVDAPSEYVEQLESLSESLVEKMGPALKSVVFVNLPLYCEKNKVEDAEGAVVIETDSAIVVHNSYVGCNTPMDFLYKYFDGEVSQDSVNPEDLSGDTYYVKGRECICQDGSFWDKATGERIRNV